MDPSMTKSIKEQILKYSPMQSRDSQARMEHSYSDTFKFKIQESEQEGISENSNSGSMSSLTSF